MSTKQRLWLAVAAVSLLALGMAAGSWWSGRTGDGDPMPQAATGTEEGRKILYWYDPMVPDKHFDQPGKSPFMDMELVPKYAEPASPGDREPLYWYDPMFPDKHFDAPGKSPFMDMELVPKYGDSAPGDGDVVRVDASTLQNLGVRTAPVEVGTLGSTGSAPATIAWDRRSTHEVSARVDGIVERLYVRAPFERVRAGQPLAELIAPEWSAAAQEYLALGRAESADARALQGAARNRLRVLGMDERQIRQLRGGSPRVVLHAPVSGVVDRLGVLPGQRVQAGMALMTINGLDTVWVEAAVPQGQAAGLVPGRTVDVRVGAYPGDEFTGVLEALLPDIDPTTRTQRARIVVDNSDHRLAPGMFAEVMLGGGAGERHPLVPDDALIATGAEARVIVAEGDGRFRPVRVVAGRSAGGRTQVLRGLEGGERVVVSGQFLIDSEASLSGALERLSTADDGHERGAGEHGRMSTKPGAATPDRTPTPDPEAAPHPRDKTPPSPEPGG